MSYTVKSLVTKLLFTLFFIVLLTMPSMANPPYTPTNPFPDNGEDGVGMLPNLSWTGGDPDGDNVTYTVKIYDVLINSGCNNQKSVDVTKNLKGTTSWTVPIKYALEPDTTYNWQVMTQDSTGLISYGSNWTFTTGSFPYIYSTCLGTARPTYPIWIHGVNFGTTKGTVKIGNRTDLACVLSWSDTEILFVLAPAAYWNNLPETFNVRIKPAGGTWSNQADLTITWGGGGTTWGSGCWR